MSNFKVSTREVLVLKILNEEGPLPVSKLKEKLNYHQVRIYAILKNLANRNMIVLKAVERVNKMGRPSSIFDITANGKDLLKLAEKVSQ